MSLRCKRLTALILPEAPLSGAVPLEECIAGCVEGFVSNPACEAVVVDYLGCELALPCEEFEEYGASHRRRRGPPAPRRRAARRSPPTLRGVDVSLSSLHGAPVWVSFSRFAACQLRDPSDQR